MKYPLHYKYFIFEQGVKLQGEIVAYLNKRYVVKWSDGEITIEKNIDPASDFLIRNIK